MSAKIMNNIFVTFQACKELENTVKTAELKYTHTIKPIPLLITAASRLATSVKQNVEGKAKVLPVPKHMVRR
jgi:hypothetical protein